MDSQERSLPLALPVINVIIQIPVSGMASNSSCLGDEMKMGGGQIMRRTIQLPS